MRDGSPSSPGHVRCESYSHIDSGEEQVPFTAESGHQAMSVMCQAAISDTADRQVCADSDGHTTKLK
jgi:hypothetical protein